MTDQGARVALLACEGEARERLRQALGEAGAQVVAVADPATASMDEVIAAAPQAVLVALEQAIEDALDDWDRLLSDPGIAVIFDEAELAANRSGWDAARWVRHLRAKLNRHDDVLPPGTEPEEEWQLAPGPLQSPVREVSEEDFHSIRQEAREAVDDVPADEGLEGWLARMSEEPAAPEPAAPLDDEARAPGSDPAPMPIDAGGLSLVDDAEPAATGVTAGPDAHGLDSLEERISGLSLADVDSYGHGPERGAVVVEAGLGGPDAVRQLLAALAAGFPRPLLVRMRLDGGRYDRLVRQMDRATILTVALAEAGTGAEPGHVYFLPPDMTVVRDKGRLLFVEDVAAGQRLPDGLPADDSAILFLSGSDPALVDEAMARAGKGTLVLGQAPEDNFDPAATSRLTEQGGSAASPPQIAAQLLERWPPPGHPAGADLEDQES